MDDVLEGWTRTRETDGGTEVWVHGREREVMNHLAVLAPMPADPTVVGSEGAVIGGIAPPTLTPRPPPLPPRFRFGQAREWLVYVVPVLVSLVMIVVIVRVARRLRRARRAT